MRDEEKIKQNETEELLFLRKRVKELEELLKEQTIKSLSGDKNQKIIEELIEREEKYRIIFNSGNDAVLLYEITENGMPGKFIEVNDVACKKLGYSREELLQMSPRDIDDIEKSADIPIIMEKIISKKQVLFEMIHVDKFGNKIPVEINAHLIELKGVNYMLSIVRDISERKRLEEELIQAQKMEAIGRLAGGISHDFNNMLTAILGYCSVIQHKLKIDDPIQEDIEEIKKAGERAAILTRQLLAFGRKQMLKMEVINLNNLVAKMEKLLFRIIGEDIKLDTDLDPKLKNVKVDPGQLEQVIMNVIVNSRDAMPDGGVITIKTSMLMIDDDYCKYIPDARPGLFTCLSIQDNGIGMDKKTIDHLFEPFFTTKEDGKGTGLGLSTVYGIIKQHEGWINIYSEPEKGTVFNIYLPVFTIEPDQYITREEDIKKSFNDMKGNGERILFVEDEEMIRKHVSNILMKNGYIVFQVPTVKKALEVFNKENGKFDIILSDIVLPDKNGIQLVDELLNTNPNLGVILTSGYSDEKSQWTTIQEKGYKFIQKPYTLPRLFQIIRELIEKQ